MSIRDDPGARPPSRIEEIEEVAPDGRVVRRRERTPRPRWELLAAILLLLLVAGFGVADWIAYEVRSGIYRGAAAAEQQPDWDVAAREFGRAGEFRDAVARAQNAGERIAARDARYGEGVRAERDGDWPAAYSAFDQAGQIQPGFRDTTARRDYALCRLRVDGLEGLIYQQMGAERGLYLRAAGRPLRLPGSDGRSRLRGSSDTGDLLIYDGAGLGTHAEATRRARPIMLARRTDPGTVVYGTDGCAVETPETAATWEAEELPELLSGDGEAIVTANGLWWISHATPRALDEPPAVLRSNWIYYSRVTRSVAPLIMPGENWLILDDDAKNEKLVLAEYLPRAVTPDTVTRIYVSGPDGGDRRQVARVQGYVRSAGLSPDGEGLLYVTRRVEADGVELLTLIHVDLRASGGRSIVVDQVFAMGGSGRTLAGSFLPRAERRILLEREDVGSDRLWIHDVELDEGTLLWSGDPKTFLNRPYFFSSDGRHAIFQTDRGAESTFVVQPLDGSGPAGRHTLSTGAQGPREVVIAADVAGAWAVLTTRAYDTRIVRESVYGIRLAGGRSPDGGQAPRLYRETFSLAGFSGSAPRQALAPSGLMLAFVDHSMALVATTLDGKLSMPVAAQVRGVWSIAGSGGDTWLP